MNTSDQVVSIALKKDLEKLSPILVNETLPAIGINHILPKNHM